MGTGGATLPGPAVTAKVTVLPTCTLLLVSRSVAVMTEVFRPSAGMRAGVAVSTRE